MDSDLRRNSSGEHRTCRSWITVGIYAVINLVSRINWYRTCWNGQVISRSIIRKCCRSDLPGKYDIPKTIISINLEYLKSDASRPAMIIGKGHINFNIWCFGGSPDSICAICSGGQRNLIWFYGVISFGCVNGNCRFVWPSWSRSTCRNVWKVRIYFSCH